MSGRRRPAKAKPSPLGVNLCSVCDEFHVTVGGQAHGGVRWCRECIKQTLGWVQLNAEQRDKLMALYTTADANPDVQWLLGALRKVPADQRQAFAIGESRRRLMDAEYREAGGYER